MLDSISIRNFKAIGDVPLELKELANVNYLVGKNGCGKSSVLEAIEMLNYFVPENVDIPNSNFYTHFSIPNQIETYNKFLRPNRNPEIVIKNIEVYNKEKEYGKYNLCLEADLSNKYFYLTNDTDNTLNDLINPGGSLSLERFNQFYTKSFSIQVSRIDIGKKSMIELIEVRNFHEPDLLELYESFLIKFLPKYKYDVPADDKILFDGEIRSFDQISSGQMVIINFANIMIRVMRMHKQGYIIIEEPENFLHPEFQKNLPKYLEHFKRHNIKFLISTHSPFIISASAKLVEKEKDEYKIINGTKKDFRPSQKVYMIDGGQTVNLANKKGKGESGYSGNNVINIASKMLGAGLDDIVSGGKSKEKVYFFYCEGKDAKIYSTIFAEKSAVFFGENCKYANMGARQVCDTYLNGHLAIKLGLGPNSKVGFVIDSSCSWEKGIICGEREDGKTEWIKTGKGIIKFSDEDREKFLIHWTKEGYNARMLIRKELENYLFDPEIVGLYNIINPDKKIEIEIENYTLEVKDNLGAYKENQKIYLELAKLISPDTSIYKELHDLIFN
jgi:AAA15 family ATPase/GTPase